MIKISGELIRNYPEEYENRLGELMMGELNSTIIAGLKTPLNVYGENVTELMELANKFKHIDPLFDIVDIYDIEENGIREYLFTRNIEKD